ncbi:MAG: antitoxin family protein [Anaerolineae bacterium]
MVAVATAIYERGTLRLLTPVNLPERARVRVQIVAEDKIGDELQRAMAVLEASGLVKPLPQLQERQIDSQTRRAELAQIYAAAVPLSEMIIAERDARRVLSHQR